MPVNTEDVSHVLTLQNIYIFKLLSIFTLHIL